MQKSQRNYFSPATYAQNESLATSASGRLDGLTILRFTHASKAGGGVEQYLEILNRTLLERNKISIIQMYSVINNEKLDEIAERIGQGKLIWVPMLERELGYELSHINWAKRVLFKFKIKNIIHNYIIYNPIFSIFFKQLIRKNEFGRFNCEKAGEKVREMFDRYKIDLVILHSASSLDSTEIINEAKKKDIPYAIHHHFDNDRLERPIIREKVLNATAVGGVSDVNIPKYVRQRFSALYDGIDTEFFKLDNAKPLDLDFEKPIILLPARIVPGKGHIDLIRAAARLKREGIQLKVVFAGRHDSPEFKKKLKILLNRLMMKDSVIFVGQLSLKELRDWYAVSKTVVLPSYTEGLPRVLLEAQSMKIPVIAYKVGGVSAALKNGETGYLVKEGSIRGLIVKLKELLLNDNRRNQMGDAGRKFVEVKFSPVALAKRNEKFYLDAISLKGNKN